MKPITKDRLIKAHTKLLKYNEHLTRDDIPMVQQMMIYSVEYVMELSGEASYEAKIETPREVEDIILTQFEKAVRIHDKRMKLHEIQRQHNISGLEMGCSKIGRGELDHWKLIEEFCLTNEDMKKLKADKHRVVQFWMDHANMSLLPVYRQVQDHWILSDTEEVRHFSDSHSWMYDWAAVWESPGSQPGRKIFLQIGIGRHQDCPDKFEQFCATNEATRSSKEDVD